MHSLALIFSASSHSCSCNISLEIIHEALMPLQALSSKSILCKKYIDSWLSIILYKSTWKCAYFVHFFFLFFNLLERTRIITIFLDLSSKCIYLSIHQIPFYLNMSTSILRGKKYTTKPCPKLYTSMDSLLFFCVQNIFKRVTERPTFT